MGNKLLEAKRRQRTKISTSQCIMVVELNWAEVDRENFLEEATWARHPRVRFEL